MKAEEINAEFIRELHKNSGLSVARFAALLGVTRQTLHNWMAGRTLPTGPALKLLQMIGTK